jgi:predicted permease
MLGFLRDAGVILLALFPVALIVMASAGVARAGWIKKGATKGLSDGIVYLFLPCLIFDKVTTGLRPDEMPLWWAIPLIAIAVFVLGGLITILVFRGRLRESPDLFPLGFIQNAGYLVLALGMQLVPEAEQGAFATFTFLYVLGHSPLLWSVGKYFISGQAAKPFDWRQLLTPPLFANLLAVTLAVSGLQVWIPTAVATAVHMLGVVTVPAGLVVLGASIAMIENSFRTDGPSIARVCLIKLVLIPAVVLSFIKLTGMNASYPLVTYMLVLQACAPSSDQLHHSCPNLRWQPAPHRHHPSGQL